jgi:predicted N-acetyltransferase YhbS
MAKVRPMTQPSAIHYLGDHLDVRPLWAAWHHEEWALDRIPSVEDRVALIRQRVGRASIPATLVAFEGATPVGFVSLIESNMDTHAELAPWLASLYVRPTHRNLGHGSALVKAVIREAHSAGVKSLYLFTPHRKGFYEQLGWRMLFNEHYRGEYVTVMICEASA